MRLLFTIVIVCLIAACSARPADDDYAYEDDAPAEAAPAPSTKAPARHGLVGSRTARGPSPLIGSRGVKTTAAPVKPAEPEVVNEPEDVDEEVAVENEEVVPVTTEAPKKGLMRGVVRPFRSNQDLLAALKRKRQQEHWRVVYEYLYVRFGYPVNLHNSLDLDPDVGGDPDARSEINEVTSGDRDPPPQFKTVTDRVVQVAQVEPVLLDRVELVEVKPSQVEPVLLERVELVETDKVEPPQVEPEKVEPKKVETEKVETEKAKPEKVETEKVEPQKVETEKVEPAKVNGTLSTSASFSVSYS